MENNYRVMEKVTGRTFDVTAKTAWQALNKASREYTRQYGHYPSEKEFTLITK